ncbi:mechanosensitive ion channel protein MscS [Mergibacter septicus]|nr:mechanosensitive ion channel protein MscS [Mergibacter septicus]
MMFNSAYFIDLVEKWSDIIFIYLIKIVLAALVIAVTYYFGKKIRYLYEVKSKNYFAERHHLNKFIAFCLSFSFMIVGYFIAIHILGLEGLLTQLLASAGVIGIVIGFATKETTANFFSGILINIQVPFKVGDWVTINGQYGQVKQIGSLLTIIMTVEGQNVYIPNQLIYTGNVVNYSSSGKRMAIVSTGVSYGDDLDKVKKVVMDCVPQIEGVITESEDELFLPRLFFTNIGSSTYNFELRIWINFESHNQYMKAINDGIVLLKKRFEEEDICIAYEVTTLDFGVKGGVNLYDKPISFSEVISQNKDTNVVSNNADIISKPSDIMMDKKV